MKHRNVNLIIVAVILCALALVSFANRTVKSESTPRVEQVDVLITGGRVFDGTNADGRIEDVGIKGERIAFVGDAAKANIQAARTIDARGLIVAPGFIDPHTHTLEDLSDAARKSNLNYLMQGVTTVVTGNDGASPLNIAETLNKWNQQGIGTNAALLIGHGSVRRKVLGMNDVAPTSEQLEQMKSLVARAMDEGAFGISTGLFYAPGSYAKTEEVIELSKVAAAHGGIYDTHQRSESTGLIDAVKETLRIGREAQIPVHISHIKAFGREQWGKSDEVIALMRAARASGINATANQYPYEASGTSLEASLMPRWAEAGGREAMLKRINDPATRARLVSEMEANLRTRNGAESFLIINVSAPALKNLIGKRLDQIARDRNETPVEAALEIIKAGGAGIASFSMNERDIENFMRQDFVMTGSDGSTGHPRKYGTFPRKFREYVFKRKIISLPFAIHASSGQTAETFHIAERGFLRVGYFADVIVFDPNTFADRATYEQPELLATGMRFVFVNGKAAIEDGKYTGALAGRALKKSDK
jgi:N-acyl-D-amino-acid deacylase